MTTYNNPDGSVSQGFPPEEGSMVAFNLAAGTTQVDNTSGRLMNVSVITSPTTASSFNDIAQGGTPAVGNQLAAIPANAAVGTIYKINMPYRNGLSVTVGTSGVLSLSYS